MQTDVQSEAAMRREWQNRPPELMQYSLAEWVELRAGKGLVGLVKVEDTVESTVTSTVEVTGRVRHSSGEMNGLEKRYAAHLEMRKTVGEIREWRYEPMKLRLAKATFWDCDFLVVMPSGAMELHEAKGHWEDDARVKIKWAAKEFSGIFKVVAVQWNKGTKDWKFEEFV